MHIEIIIDEHITMTLLNFDNEINIISTHLIKKMKLNQDEKILSFYRSLTTND